MPASENFLPGLPVERPRSPRRFAAARTTLAVLGGAPTFAEPLHVGRPNLGDRARLQERIDALLDRRWLTNGGPFVREFEQRLAQFLGVKHCIATCNATTALMLASRALGMTGEVIMPSFNFVAAAHALQWQGTTPVFADIDPRTYNLDPRHVERHITPRTTGLLAVHLWGRACDTAALAGIARRHGLKLLFDASHAFGNTHGGVRLGGFGDAEVFSFHATKFLNAFEGGAVATNNDQLARKLALMKNFGFTDYDQVDHLGINGKMTEICAAMGLTSLESFDEFVAVNRRNYLAYHAALDALPGLRVLSLPENEQGNYQYVIVEIDETGCALTRDELIQVLHAENILSRRYFHPGCHRMEPYRSAPPAGGWLLPETEKLSNRVLTLPTGTAVGFAEIAVVSEIIQFALKNAEAIRAHLISELPSCPS